MVITKLLLRSRQQQSFYQYRRAYFFKDLLKPPTSNLQNVDINEQLSSLRESDVKITFSDIWNDYKNYRLAYYYYTDERVAKFVKREPGCDDKGEFPVDVDNFSVRKYAWWVIKHLGSHERGTFPHLYTFLFVLTIFAGSARLGFEVKGLMYGYKDPLVKDEEDAIDQVSAENTLRRLKYRRKIKDWRQVPYAE